MEKTFQPRLVFLSHLASSGDLDGKKMHKVTAGKISYKGCILFGFERVTAGYVSIPWTGELENDNFLRSLAKNEYVGLLSSC